ncbi:SMI1/KNR4 family protein [Salmonella enterica]|uniref:SMI1/KNR4 family protein n=1 Tax=Salmonella enterica TaxID=28901 RepID=UPI0010115D34|nr:SMI1/KNR4 family protein [Salmonella enterica]EDS4738684.1 SMI1/KNR4 family protein [Salmonella enterica subsp. enterica serovar Oranienburg]EJF5648088.1 SMI1/KNR4 family protein [Salmonella enterica]EJF6002651.1 SMI1/KNR4 family protein [Salmonella enterica]EJF6030216.1 SMI1/KNR4 family protein [Salmonella enterica]EJF6191693.1 SMI1/KNR4 family protein [Salmonella enterica]
MWLTIEEAEKKLTQDEFVEFEKHFSKKFPDGFKNFYLENNGGYLPETVHPSPLLFSGFISIKYGKVPIEKIYQDLIDDFPELNDMVPFADDEGGNCFLLSLRDKDYGRIYIWLMDEKELVFVSETFDNFIKELL